MFSNTSRQSSRASRRKLVKALPQDSCSLVCRFCSRQDEVVERVLEGSLEQLWTGDRGRGLVIEQTDELGPEIRAGLRLGLGQFRQDHEELVGTAAIGGGQPVGPEIGQLAFTQVLQGGDGETLDVFDQGDAQHLGDSP